MTFVCSSCKLGNTAESEDSTTKSYIGRDDAVPVEFFLKDIKNNDFSPSRDVKKLSAMFNAIVLLKSKYGSCTGFLIHPEYIMTNQHCFYHKSSAEIAAGVKFLDKEDGERYYSKDVCESLLIYHSEQTASAELRETNFESFQQTKVISRCESVIVSNQARDVTIFKIRPNPQLARDLASGAIKPLELGIGYYENDPVFIVGHPRGAPKVISYINRNLYNKTTVNCRSNNASYPPGKGPKNAPNPYLSSKYPFTFTHDCDTTGGSSGSPIIDYKSMKVVGLHWDGWRSSKYPHYYKNGPIDNLSDVGNQYPYKEGNAAIDMKQIRKYILALEGLPEELLSVFR
jgi:V8-like Glu-specific endopeptidase